MPGPSPAPSSTIRLGTFNIGLGFVRKLPNLLTRCNALSLDIVALQETGDPALLVSSKLVTSFSYTFVHSPGPSHHEAGVGLLISSHLMPRVRGYKRSNSGRLVGALIDLAKGQRLLVISAYMPSGLDHSHPSSEKHSLAHNLYEEALAWCYAAPAPQQVILMGDLNQTLTPHDRFPVPISHHSLSSSPYVAPIMCLPQAGFDDAFRSMHPSASILPGYTHESLNQISRRVTQSRIDYIWTKGFTPACFLRSAIDTKLRSISHHHLLCLELVCPCSLPDPNTSLPMFRMRVPNLRSVYPELVESFAAAVDTNLLPDHKDIISSLSSAAATVAMIDVESPIVIDAAVDHITSLVREAAFSVLPVTGSAPLRNKPTMYYHRQRAALAKILNIARHLHRTNPRVKLFNSPEWVRQRKMCSRQYGVKWEIDARQRGSAFAWIEETAALIRRSRAITRHHQHQLSRKASAVHREQLDTQSTAVIHRMLQSNNLPSQLFSVIDPSGDLTSNAEEVKQVMADHFESVFDIPPAPPPLWAHLPPPAMLACKALVDPAWYHHLMDPVTPAELLRVLSHCPRVSAAGQDEVSIGVWKLAIQTSKPTRDVIVSLFTACLTTAYFPAAWKSSVIVPLVKDTHRDRSMQNIRPISLQSCLGKLFNKLLAHRLTAIFARHPILNSSQRGFINGGTTIKCIDELLDAWEWSRQATTEQYTLFYDIKQAYDSVQTHILARAMHRLCLPPTFIQLVERSLTNLSSCVRTIYGNSRHFAVKRSLRQGDPLAPVLFVILMDPLHDGLERNPFTGQQHGSHIGPRSQRIYLPSLGYADDTTIITDSLPDLKAQNDWVSYFMESNLLCLNPAKCEIVGRRSDGEALTQVDLQRHGILVDGKSLVPISHGTSVRYLGAHCAFDGRWTAQQKKSREMIMLFTRAMVKFQVPINSTVYIFNTFLLPKLEIAFHYVHGPGTSAWVKDCDRMLIGCIKHAASSPLRLSHSALALTIQLKLPSWLETTVKVSELFHRMNSTDTRWGVLGRLLMRHQCSSSVHSASPLRQPDSGTRLTRAAYLAVIKLQWRLDFLAPTDPVLGRASRHQHVFTLPTSNSLPLADSCSSCPAIQLSRVNTHLVHDHWSGWIDPLHASETVHVYTDGSYKSDPQSLSSAWSVVVHDQWLDLNHALVPVEEFLIRPVDVAGSTSAGCFISCSQGIYPAELQAIARALAMVPCNFILHIHSDSRSSISAINSYIEETNERKRLRMAARPLLHLIHSLIQRRNGAGGQAVFHHVAAHTDNTDIHSVGNRLADYRANLCRLSAPKGEGFPSTLTQLPLDLCELHLSVRREFGLRRLQLIDDVRRASNSEQRQSAFEKWVRKPDFQGKLASEGMLDLGQVVMSTGNSFQQVTLVHVCTNSIEYHWVESVAVTPVTSTLHQVCCVPCDSVMSLEHLSTCPQPLATQFRQSLHHDLLTLISHYSGTRNWIRRVESLTLTAMLDDLFPFPSLLLPAAAKSAHQCLSMLGAFSVTQSKSAIRKIAFTDTSDGTSALQRFRLICLSHVGEAYAKWKPP